MHYFQCKSLFSIYHLVIFRGVFCYFYLNWNLPCFSAGASLWCIFSFHFFLFCRFACCMLGIYSHGKAAKDTPVYPWSISHMLTKQRTYASGGHEHWNSTWAATDDVDACPRPHQTKARQGTLALGNSLSVTHPQNADWLLPCQPPDISPEKINFFTLAME